MPIVAYQSFNSNSSSTHGAEQASFQLHTRMANQTALTMGQQVLPPPILSDNLALPVEGPANLVTVGDLGSKKRKRSGSDAGDEAKRVCTGLVHGDHVATIYQNVIRAVGAAPDLLVIGEIDVSHPDFKLLAVRDPAIKAQAHPNAKACQCFSSFSNTGLSSQVQLVETGIGFVAFAVAGTTIVFVHVPNDAAADATKTKAFYGKVRDAVKAKNHDIDIVMGDTNQKSFGHTANCLNAIYGDGTFETGGSKQIQLFDSYDAKGVNGQQTVQGTNSKANVMFDVVAYRGKSVAVEKLAYYSQSSTGSTVTDHCGLALRFARKS